MLGREVLHGALSGGGEVTFDISKLSRGIYSVILEYDNARLPVGKVAVVGR